jgi:biopolymer transport protein ExbD
MKFSTRKSRNPPSVIIVSLIDVLIVVLIFLMVATTFKQHPAIKLALPESKQSGGPSPAPDNIVITVSKAEPRFFVGPRPVTFDKLQEELRGAAAKNPAVGVSIRADTEAPFGEIVRVMDATKAAGLRSVSAFIRSPASK